MDRSRWRKLIKDDQDGCVWVNVSSGTGWTRVVRDKGPLNGCVCMCINVSRHRSVVYPIKTAVSCWILCIYCLPELGVDISDTPSILPFKKAKSCDFAIKCWWWYVLYRLTTQLEDVSIYRSFRTTVLTLTFWPQGQSIARACHGLYLWTCVESSSDFYFAQIQTEIQTAHLVTIIHWHLYTNRRSEAQRNLMHVAGYGFGPAHTLILSGWLQAQPSLAYGPTTVLRS